MYTILVEFLGFHYRLVRPTAGNRLMNNILSQMDVLQAAAYTLEMALMSGLSAKV